MNPRVVVDVGNTRIKWGLCSERAVEAMASLTPEESAWQRQVEDWGLAAPSHWTLAGVHPGRRDSLAAWLRGRGNAVFVLTAAGQLPIRVALEQPEKVGIDRLLNAVAVLGLEDPRLPAIIIDVGSAVTVDWLTDKGAFAGGTIFPGFRLMAKALHDYTALLPEVEIREAEPVVPGTSTITAMQAGIYWAVGGGIEAINARLRYQGLDPPSIYMTGGDASLLLPVIGDAVRHWPEMTLEGLRRAAVGIP
jgi:type III pantothenate kinase